MRKNNKGLTLVELVVTIAIIAIFSGVVLTLISNGANSYRSTSSNAQVQRETQETLDQIQDLVIDANRSVYYTYGDDEEVGSIVWNDVDNDSGSNAMTKTFLICNVKEISNTLNEYLYDVLQWDATSHKLYYSQKKYTKQEESEPENTPEASMLASDEKIQTENFDEGLEDKPTSVSGKTSDVETLIGRSELASNLMNFCVDIRKVESERIVRFLITTKVSNKEIKTIHTVKLRNQIQVAAPDKAFGEAESKSGSIKIINAPKELNAGDSCLLDKLLIGNVDPSSVRWEILDSSSATGTFAKEDPTYGKLTVDKDQSGYITVRVYAQTTTGETVDDEVDIKINGTAYPQEIWTDNNVILLGAGNTYDLDDIVSWYVGYSDGTIGTEKESVSWSGGDEFVTLNRDGRLVISDKAGKQETSTSIIVTATDNENNNLTGTVTINIARIDIETPAGTYKVGEEKTLSYVYQEAGVVIDIDAEFFVETLPQIASAYLPGTLFLEQDIGEWEVSVSFELSKRSGYGRIHGENKFNVENDKITDVTILCNNETRTQTIFAGTTYTCSYYNRNLFFIDVPLHEEGYWHYNLVWEIEGESDANTRLENDTIVDNGDVRLNVGDDEKGFILSATMTIFDRDTDTVVKQYKGSAYINIINKVEIISPGKEVVIGRTYPLIANVYESTVAKSGNRYSYSSRVSDGGDRDIRWSADNAQNFDAMNRVWKIANTQSSTYITADLETVDGAMNGEKHKILTDKVETIVIEPPISLSAVDKDGQTNSEISSTQSLDLKAILTFDGELTTDKTVNWTCYNRNGENKTYEVLNKTEGLDVIFRLPQYMQSSDQYTVTATFSEQGIEPRSANYIILVN